MADKTTLQVTAQLYRVAGDFTARAGEQVMIVAGVCIGVYTGEPAAPKPKAAAPEPAKGKVKPGRGSKPGRTMRSNVEAEAVRVEMRRALCGLFRQQQDLTLSSSELARAYPGPAAKYHLRIVLTEMRSDRVISLRGKGRTASYTLLNSSVCEARPEATSATGDRENADA